jgi:nucleotide-binding universal stress UspA family protein
MHPIRKILAAIDFSPCSERAAEYAVELAGPLGATVTLLHVYSVPVVSPFPGATPLYVASPATMAEVASVVMQQLDELRSRIHRPEIGIAIHALEGSPKELIPRFADERDFDLIVVGTHGRTGVRHLLIGSVAEAVVRHALRPVLTVHEPTKEAAHSAP